MHSDQTFKTPDTYNWCAACGILPFFLIKFFHLCRCLSFHLILFILQVLYHSYLYFKFFVDVINEMFSHFHVFFFFLLYNTVLVLPYINMTLPRVYMSSQSWTPSFLPPHTISLGHPSAPAPSILYPGLNLDWRFVSYMILYMFQCRSPSFNTVKKRQRKPLT